MMSHVNCRAADFSGPERDILAGARKREYAAVYPEPQVRNQNLRTIEGREEHGGNPLRILFQWRVY
jgi:hypothetical protein